MRQLKAFLSKYINWTFLISVLFIAVICGVLSLKAEYFVDEIFTYGKANYKTPASVQIKDGAGVVYIGYVNNPVVDPLTALWSDL